jgi:hypothetical protein
MAKNAVRAAGLQREIETVMLASRSECERRGGTLRTGVEREKQ